MVKKVEYLENKLAEKDKILESILEKVSVMDDRLKNFEIEKPEVADCELCLILLMYLNLVKSVISRQLLEKI